MIISCKDYAKCFILRVGEDSDIFELGLYEILDLPPVCRGKEEINCPKR